MYTLPSFTVSLQPLWKDEPLTQPGRPQELCPHEALLNTDCPDQTGRAGGSPGRRTGTEVRQGDRTSELFITPSTPVQLPFTECLLRARPWASAEDRREKCPWPPGKQLLRREDRDVHKGLPLGVLPREQASGWRRGIRQAGLRSRFRHGPAGGPGVSSYHRSVSGPHLSNGIILEHDVECLRRWGDDACNALGPGSGNPSATLLY